MEPERWRDIPLYEGSYQVSSFGRVKSLVRIVYRGGQSIFKAEKILKPFDKQGFDFIALSKDGCPRHFPLHYLVAAAFVENPSGFSIVVNLDNNPKNNHFTNLKWVSKEDARKVRFGTEFCRCKQCGEKFAVQKYKTKRGIGFYCSYSCFSKSEIGREAWNKGKTNPSMCGDKHHQWKGGVTSANEKIRKSPAYKEWRKMVIERDGLKCFFCGTSKAKFHVDHIRPFIENPGLRLDVSNGRVVCEGCHIKTRTYGKPLSCRAIHNKGLKKRIIELSFKHKASHLGSNLTAVDIIYDIFKRKGDGERFYLSAGHYALALFVVLERLFKYDAESLMLKHGTHCKKDDDHKIYCTNGSLGCVMGIALGYALSNKNENVHCLISDGELAEGSITETFITKRLCAASNLKIYVNMNGIGAYGLIDVDKTMKHILSFDQDAKIYHTNPNQLPFLKDLDAHYFTMKEYDYKVAMEILS